jgi:protein-L-isoaspartate(D-aspartate) O-methyltransferase
MNIKIQYTANSALNWSREHLLSVLTTGKTPILTDPLIINAFSKIDRKDFVPEQQKHLAYNDVNVDVGFNETLSSPTTIGKVLSILKPRYGGKYLDIGTGTGYIATLLGFIAGQEGHVYTLERVQWLWEIARANAQKYPNLKNIDYLYRDGQDGLIQKAPYDGIHFSFSVNQVSENILKQLKINGGILVCPTNDYHLRVIERKTIDEFEEELIPGFLFEQGKEGIA